MALTGVLWDLSMAWNQRLCFFHLGLYVLFIIRVVVIIIIWTIYPIWLVPTFGEMASLCLLFLAFPGSFSIGRGKGRKRETHISYTPCKIVSSWQQQKRLSLSLPLSLPTPFHKDPLCSFIYCLLPPSYGWYHLPLILSYCLVMETTFHRQG